MTYDATVVVRTLRPTDLPDLMRLKTAAFWNQTQDDWLRLLRLEPDGCFGIEIDGAVIATATAVRYGSELAWIGMVLTLPEFRGRGFARTLMERALDFAGPSVIRLDASDQGQPLYESMGFRPECAIERWRRDPSPASARTNLARSVDYSLDRAVFGADRTLLLQELLRYESASLDGGYAFARPGSEATYFGPCVALDIHAASSLFRWFVGNHAHEPAVVDLFPHQNSIARLASDLDFKPFRRLMRMVRDPAPAALPDRRIVAIAGFEWG